MKNRFVENDNANEQINNIAEHVRNGVDDSKIAMKLIDEKIINLKNKNYKWDSEDIRKIRIKFNLSKSGMKRCQYCGEDIKEEAIVCRYCRCKLSNNNDASMLINRNTKKEGKYTKSQKNILFGLLWFFGGLIISIATYESASNGGTYVIAWGAILFGFIQFIYGMTQDNKASEDLLFIKKDEYIKFKKISIGLFNVAISNGYLTQDKNRNVVNKPISENLKIYNSSTNRLYSFIQKVWFGYVDTWYSFYIILIIGNILVMVSSMFITTAIRYYLFQVPDDDFELELQYFYISSMLGYIISLPYLIFSLVVVFRSWRHCKVLFFGFLSLSFSILMALMIANMIIYNYKHLT